MNIDLTIDGRPVKAPAGVSILEAAQSAEVTIPTLCHDDGLHPYGACRICMVEVEGPQRRLLPACTTPAAQGMTVQTMTPAVIQARKDILELLLINHPLDCPVCDKAGECRLQDLVHEYGLGPGRFSEPKRTVPPDHGSPLIERNQNRCILCGKCVRVCTERCGVGALTIAGRGGRSRISAAFDGILDCEFCGECVDICPVGALSTKQFKHKARAWSLEHTPSTCNVCGCGCPLVIETHRGSAVRVRPDKGGYLCAKGRFGWDAVRHESRLRLPMVRRNGVLANCSWDEALSVIATNLKVIKHRSGADSIGGLGSVRTTNEDNYVFQKFMRSVVGTNNVDLLARMKLPFGLNAAHFSEEIASIGKHDVILLLAGDAGEINPLTGIEIIRAVNRGNSRLILVNNGQNKFNRLASVVIPHEAEPTLESLAAALRGMRKTVSIRTGQAVELLRSANSVAVVLPEHLTLAMFSLIQELAGQLRNVSYYPVMTRGNIQGALDMGVLPGFYPGYLKVEAAATALFSKAWNTTLPEVPGMNAAEMMNGVGSGKIAALYIMGDDPVLSAPGLAAALPRLEFLVVQDLFLTETARIAHVVLPAAGFLEKNGTVTTIERRLRRISPAEAPAGETRQDWQILESLARRMGAPMAYATAAEVMKEIKAVTPLYANLAANACWPRELSPLNSSITDLSLSSDAVPIREVITAKRLLFSSGGMMIRSKEMGSIIHEGV